MIVKSLQDKIELETGHAPNQFMPKPLNHGFQPLTNLDDRQNQIEVFNPGASGLQMVEASVPNDQLSNSFTIGGSLAVGGTGK